MLPGQTGLRHGNGSVRGGYICRALSARAENALLHGPGRQAARPGYGQYRAGREISVRRARHIRPVVCRKHLPREISAHYRLSALGVGPDTRL